MTSQRIENLPTLPSLDTSFEPNLDYILVQKPAGGTYKMAGSTFVQESLKLRQYLDQKNISVNTNPNAANNIIFQSDNLLSKNSTFSINIAWGGNSVNLIKPTGSFSVNGVDDIIPSYLSRQEIIKTINFTLYADINYDLVNDRVSLENIYYEITGNSNVYPSLNALASQPLNAAILATISTDYDSPTVEDAVKYVPPGSNSYGIPGQFGYDENYMYFCINVNRWKRFLLVDFPEE